MHLSLSDCTKLAIFGMGFLLTGCETMSPELAAKCEQPDNINVVSGGGICFGIKTYYPPLAHWENLRNPTLLVYLHGDVSRGGPADYMHSYAAKPPEGTVSVAMFRPGYYGSDGTRSSGHDNNRRDHYTATTVDAIAEAIGSLREKHHSPRVVLIGHSGGAAISGILLGRHPSVAEAALLVSCPCDLAAWRATHGRRWSMSLSPSTYIDAVSTNTQVIAITGENDTNTLPRFAADYVMRLSARGVDARFIQIPRGHHKFSSLTATGAYYDALQSLIDQKRS